MQDMTIGEALRKYRLEREWTYRQLATAAGVSLATIHAIVKRGQQPNELTLTKIMNRLPGLLGNAA